MIDVEEFRKKLIDLGFDKVYVLKKELGCVIYIGIFQNRELIIAISRGMASLYAKIFLADAILSSHLQCNYIKYFPMGWYVFSNDVNDLAKRLINKASKIIGLQKTS
uniref:Uncharacterized protein n=1 Tax=Ignisphaera aggregans TaxID=334771 RepID=A0A7J3QE88_9CREN